MERRSSLFCLLRAPLTEETEERSANIPEVQVVMSLGLTTVREKVNALGKQGYRLATMNKGAAVMYRYSETMKPFAYKWLKAGDKRFDEQLAKLQSDGAVSNELSRTT